MVSPCDDGAAKYRITMIKVYSITLIIINVPVRLTKVILFKLLVTPNGTALLSKLMVKQIFLSLKLYTEQNMSTEKNPHFITVSNLYYKCVDSKYQRKTSKILNNYFIAEKFIRKYESNNMYGMCEVI